MLPQSGRRCFKQLGFLAEEGGRKRAASCCDWSDCPEQNIMGYSTSQQDVVASALLQASVECIREAYVYLTTRFQPLVTSGPRAVVLRFLKAPRHLSSLTSFKQVDGD
ncbi:hypothetical protein WJX82_006639 [Trebouxia sp. C0006]